jgi:hypothetical protein
VDISIAVTILSVISYTLVTTVAETGIVLVVRDAYANNGYKTGKRTF